MNDARPNLRRILRSVSRSFYLSIRFLPVQLREPIQLAYLLARTTDTVADTHAIPSEKRAAVLAMLSAAIAGAPSQDVLVDLGHNFAPYQTDPAERTLIDAAPQLLRALDACDAADRAEIRQLLAKIARGQMLDIERFATPGQGLATTAELREYTYLVAGCVGEFWTRVCARRAPNFSRATDMETRGRRYGEGLQLINILRDAHADLLAGRCYFPREQLDASGIRASEITRTPERFLPIYHGWLDEAQRGLEAGMDYVEAIDMPRLRGATVLPALIGARTVALLRQAGVEALQRRVKIPRQEVRKIIGAVAITLANRRTIRRMFDRYLK